MPSHLTAKASSTTVAQFMSKPLVAPFKNLPCDIFMIIVEYLTPKDLLQLYRSNKAMREYLGRSGKHEWRCAWKNEPDLPPCPPWLTEPQFAALCFDDHCQNCLQPDLNGAGLVWKLNARYCFACMSTQLTINNPLEGLPRGSYLEEFIDKPYLCVPYTSRQVVINGWQIMRNHFHIPHITRLHRDILAASDGPGGDAELNERRLSVMRKWEAQLREHSVHAERYTIWQTAREERIRAQRLLAKQQRRKAIFARIQALGYALEIKYLGREFQALEGGILAVFDKVDPLTEDDWAVISPTVIAFFDQRRALRQRHEHIAEIYGRMTNLTRALDEYRGTHHDEIWPHPVDICGDPALVSVFSLPTAAWFPYEIFPQLLPAWIQVWRKRREDILFSMLARDAPSIWRSTEYVSHPGDLPSDTPPLGPAPPTLFSSGSSDEPLQLPSSVFARFYCVVCRTVISHGVAMTHRCCYRHDADRLKESNPSPWLDGKFHPASANAFEAACAKKFGGNLGWSPLCLRPCAAMISDLLVTLGVDLKSPRPDVGRIDNMHVACSSCRRENALLVMGWQRAVEHAFQTHDGAGLRWTTVPPAISYPVQCIEQARWKLTEEEMSKLPTWRCLHCSFPEALSSLTPQQLKPHMNICHNIANPVHNQDYLETPGRAEYMHPTILVVASELRGAGLNTVFQEGDTFGWEQRVGFLAYTSLAGVP
ncbi:hypothetical protein TRAPUB_2581 [Trametes pubescens]|uniref:F-box domain-containing protein n=1 Tax=Trametes pubescens TaxID=154538 RepID=A0A1M2VG80_TRAPU|nr:hypothetical protein TRAPUB_2581 [Trametes pubescens]